MYTNEDLDVAVKQGIFTELAVENFKHHIAKEGATVDEENFRFVSGFNDIFVSIALGIVLISAGWIAGQREGFLGAGAVALLAWLLSIFIVTKKRLALPAIMLVIFYLISVFYFFTSVFTSINMEPTYATVLGRAAATLAAWLHWLCFRVPITVAIGISFLVAFLVFLLAHVEIIKTYINILICLMGIMTFFLAMKWDAKDTSRTTRRSDVAFWLHLLAAPLIVHPIFLTLGILDGEGNTMNIMVIIVMYLLLAAISIAIDRRALMVSALCYVLYAFSQLFNSYGMLDYSLAIAGVLIGTALLLLSAYWHKSRAVIFKIIPNFMRHYLPPAS